MSLSIVVLVRMLLICVLLIGKAELRSVYGIPSILRKDLDWKK